MFRRLSKVIYPHGRASASTQSTETEEEPGKAGRSNELELQQPATQSDLEGQISSPVDEDAFGDEEGAEVQYKTCAWW